MSGGYVYGNCLVARENNWSTSGRDFRRKTYLNCGRNVEQCAAPNQGCFQLHDRTSQLPSSDDNVSRIRAYHSYEQEAYSKHNTPYANIKHNDCIDRRTDENGVDVCTWNSFFMAATSGNHGNVFTSSCSEVTGARFSASCASPMQKLQRHLRHQQLSTSGNFTTEGKRRRRRVITAAQRSAANIRERHRMCQLNDAFDVLRKRVPTFAYEKKLSRIDTLKLAVTYIEFMADILKGEKQNWKDDNTEVTSCNDCDLDSACHKDKNDDEKDATKSCK